MSIESLPLLLEEVMVVLEAAGRQLSSSVVELGLILRPRGQRDGAAGEVGALVGLKVVVRLVEVLLLLLRMMQVEPVTNVTA